MKEDSNNFPERTTSRRVEVRELGRGSAKKEVPVVERMPGEAPTQQGRTRRRRGRGSRSRGGQAAQMNAKAVAVVGFLIAVTIGGAMWFGREQGLSEIPGSSQSTGWKSPIRKEYEDVEISKYFMSLSHEEAEEAIEAVVRGFMESSTVEERLQWVRPVSGLRERMEEFYGRQGARIPAGLAEILSSSPVAFEGVPMQVVIARGKEEEEPYPFTVLPGRDRMLIDWDSSVGFGERSWEEYLATRPVESVQLRVFLRVDDYFNYEFSDDRHYACFRVERRGSEKTLYGYVERGSETEKRLRKSIEWGASMPMNVRLRFPKEGASKRMVWIEEVIHPFWVDVKSLEEAREH